MSVEDPFNPDDKEARIINVAELKAKMRPEQLANYEMAVSRNKTDRSLTEARLNVEQKKNRAAEEVELRELAQLQEKQADSNLICHEMATAMKAGNFKTVELLINTHLKTETAFSKPKDIQNIQMIFNRLSNVREDMVIMHEPKNPDVRITTVYEKVNMADGSQKLIGITVNADFSFNPNDPMVTFNVREISTSQSSIADEKLEMSTQASEPETHQSPVQRFFSFFKRLFSNK